VKLFRIDWLKCEVGLSVGVASFKPSHAISPGSMSQSGADGEISLQAGPCTNGHAEFNEMTDRISSVDFKAEEFSLR
jgi:hypothetical protein